jgi:hypothetical protein
VITLNNSNLNTQMEISATPQSLMHSTLLISAIKAKARLSTERSLDRRPTQCITDNR